MNVIEFHTWNATKNAMDKPDRMVFDLDPGEGVRWSFMQEAAQLVRIFLNELELVSFLKTSGGKGLACGGPHQEAARLGYRQGFLASHRRASGEGDTPALCREKRAEQSCRANLYRLPAKRPGGHYRIAPGRLVPVRDWGFPCRWRGKNWRRFPAGTAGLLPISRTAWTQEMGHGLTMKFHGGQYCRR